MHKYCERMKKENQFFYKTQKLMDDVITNKKNCNVTRIKLNICKM